MTVLYKPNYTGKFEEDFEIPFGQHGKQKVYYGVSANSPTNDTTIDGQFTTPSHVENDVSLYGGDTMMMGGDRVMVVGPNPQPRAGDDDLVGVRYYMQGSNEGRLSMFVNDSPEDPAPPVDFVTGEPMPRDTWLLPDKTYYFSIVRLHILESGAHPPLGIEYTGTSPADGNEEELDPIEVEMVINGVSGTWTPS